MSKLFRKSLIASTVMLATVNATAAEAQGQPMTFEKADRDSNGMISYQEAERALDVGEGEFVRSDVDQNGNLSPQEFAQAQMLMQQYAQQTRGNEQAGLQQGEQSRQAGAAPQGSRIQVEEQPSKIQVTQPEPRITVTQPEPNITVTQPEPVVSVQTPEPQVEVKSAKPEVRVVQSGEPEVVIKRSDEISKSEPMADAGDPGDKNLSDKEAAEPDTNREAQGGGTASALMAKRAEDLKGMEVENRNDEDIGNVEKVVVDPKTNRLYVVVSVGGLLGIGDKQIPMALDEMELRDDELIAPTSKDDDEIEKRDRYVAENYRDVDDSTLLKDAAANANTSATGFAEIDRDNDGYISQAEAEDDDRLKDGWKNIDADNNQQIDRMEFSAFERKSGN